MYKLFFGVRSVSSMKNVYVDVTWRLIDVMKEWQKFEQDD